MRTRSFTRMNMPELLIWCMEYDLKFKWRNLESLRECLIENDWSEFNGKHPNFQFIYESHQSREQILYRLVDALDKVDKITVIDRKSWENVDYHPGGPIYCSRENAL